LRGPGSRSGHQEQHRRHGRFHSSARSAAVSTARKKAPVFAQPSIGQILMDLVARCRLRAARRNSGGIQLGVSVLSASNDMLARAGLVFVCNEVPPRRAFRRNAVGCFAFAASKTFEVFSMPNSTTGTATWTTRCSTCLALAIFVQFPIWVAFASAQSPSSAVREFGLFGTWADDCNTNPSPLNQYASFSISSRGTIQLRNDFGPDYGDMIYRIVDAKRIGLFRISLVSCSRPMTRSRSTPSC